MSDPELLELEARQLSANQRDGVSSEISWRRSETCDVHVSTRITCLEVMQLHAGELTCGYISRLQFTLGASLPFHCQIGTSGQPIFSFLPRVPLQLYRIGTLQKLPAVLESFAEASEGFVAHTSVLYLCVLQN